MNLNRLRKSIREQKLTAEHGLVNKLIFDISLTKQQRTGVVDVARSLVDRCRDDQGGKGTMDSFLLEFGLSNKEGVGLMCLAEALLRVPDAVTADRLIAEKIHSGDWASHSGNSESLFVNASTWGLMLTGHMVQLDPKITEKPGHWVKRLTAKMGEPVIRTAVHQAMKIMGGQYVLGRTIDEGMKRGIKENTSATRFSFDMLGEAARTEQDALRYFTAYEKAIVSIGTSNLSNDVHDANGISVKLSALHSHYQVSHHKMVMAELLPRITELCVQAKKHNIGLSIDAEEAARLDMSLDIFEALARNSELAGWDGLGFVLQAYQKCSPFVAQWLIELGKETNRRFMVRLVKGAYWDAEIKHAQEQGHKDYPVFTRKANTDLCYLHCAKILLSAQSDILPQFATHNAYTASVILELAAGKEFEFQRLHGMGHLLYRHLFEQFPERRIPLRVYAPIGEHQDLLPYLVRRLLENGANSSFVNRFLDKKMPSEELVKDACDQVIEVFPYMHSGIPLPTKLFEAQGEQRQNAKGIDLDCRLEMDSLAHQISAVQSRNYSVGPVVDGVTFDGSSGCEEKRISNPADQTKPVGVAYEVTDALIEQALESARRTQAGWERQSVRVRSRMLNRVADLLQGNLRELVGLICFEAGRTIPDAVSEVREAIDFCRYYALQAEKVLTGESDKNTRVSGLKACGTFFCISPWNFPLAIFTGQIAAALAVGNSVIAKPAEQTPLVAHTAIKLFHQAGVPTSVLHLVIGSGLKVGEKILPDPRINGVCFTGSTETARRINQTIAARPGSAIPLIAETGGQNCMIVDSTALPEQVVDDVITSSFMGAGQRCSALRVLFVQSDIADNLLEMLAGAMQSVVIGDPAEFATEVGPVIDEKALDVLQAHAKKMRAECKYQAAVPTPPGLTEGTYFAPRVFEIESIQQLTREVFGPILHVIRYRVDGLDDVIAQINSTGYGLTLGVHSRIEAFADYVFRKTNVGNTYINRNMVGAVVGVNPFGGNNLSGTGPKAGGPNYLYRFCRLAARPLWPKQNETELSQNNLALSEEQKTILDKAHAAFLSLKQVQAGQRATSLSNLALHQVADKTLIEQFNTFCKLAVDKVGAPIELPGPTGEENLLLGQGKGPVLCLTSNNDSLNQIGMQIGACIASGCPAIIAASAGTKERIQALVDVLNAAEQLPPNTLQITGNQGMGAFIREAEFCAVTVSAGSQNPVPIKQALSQRSGCILPLVEFSHELYPRHEAAAFSLMSYLINEKTRTENLTARGGNTQLMNLHG